MALVAANGGTIDRLMLGSMLGSAQELGGSATRNMYVLFVLLFVEKHGDGAVY